tara:strand:- start:768 stop:1124 length:357 start_codon:yes stop_codon:yes gene_type:complete
MSELKVKGTIIKIIPVESVGSEGKWKKGGFLLNTGAQFKPNVLMTLFGEDKIALLDSFSEGQEVEASFNISSTESKSKAGTYFSNIDCWKIQAVNSASVASSQPPVKAEDIKDEDLPF